MHQRIACIGGATVDRKVEPLERLRAGTSNPVRSELCSGGTARNIAEALARLGCPVSLVSRVGDDTGGNLVLDELAALAVDLDGIDRVNGGGPRSSTASYTAILDERGELAMGLADMEILDALSPDWIDSRLDQLSRCDLWIVDANLPAAVLARLFDLAPEGVRIFAEPVSVAKSRRLAPLLDRIHTIFPDRGEAAALAESGIDSEPEELAERIRGRGARRVVMTLGDRGVWVDEPPTRQRVPALPVSAVGNVTGAGDCFVAGYVFGQTAGSALDPVRCGLAAAALAVESARTVPADLTAERLLARYRESR